MSLNENEEIDVDEIFEKIINYFGFVPKIFQVLSDNPAALQAYYIKLEVIMKDESLTSLNQRICIYRCCICIGG